MSSESRIELIEILVREGYVERQVTLASGKVSDYYLDCRPVMLLPRGSYLAGELMLDLIAGEGIEQISGMAVAAIPVISSIIAAAYRRNIPLRGSFVRKETKAHGLQKRIEGAFKAGVKTAVVDDAVTTGGSTLEALAVLREAGANVTNSLALVDRNEGAREALTNAGLKHQFVIDANEIRNAARSRK